MLARPFLYEATGLVCRLGKVVGKTKGNEKFRAGNGNRKRHSIRRDREWGRATRIGFVSCQSCLLKLSSDPGLCLQAAKATPGAAVRGEEYERFRTKYR